MTDHDSSYTFILDLNGGACDSKVFIDADSALAKRIADTRPWLSPDDADRFRTEVERSEKGRWRQQTQVWTRRSMTSAPSIRPSCI